MFERENSTVVFTDDFANGLQNWTLYATACVGKWELENQELVYRLAPPNTMGRGFISTRSRFQKIHSVDLEFYVPENAPCEVDIWLRSFYYTSVGRISRKEDGTQNLLYQRMNSVTRTGMAPMLRQDITQGGWLKWGDWNCYRMEITGQTFTLYLNGQPALQYLDPEYPVDEPVCIHLKTSAEATRFRNFKVAADQILPQQQAISERTEETAYTAQMTMDRTRPYGFLEAAGEKTWSMSLRNGVPVYGTAGSETLCSTWLHGFEKDPVVEAELLCEKPCEDGSCGLMARFAVDGSYLRAGYDFGQKAWFIAACLGVQYRKQYFSSDVLPGMEPDTCYSLRLECRDRAATLYVNGEIAVCAEDLGNTSYGRMGLFSCKTGLYARSFSCRMPNGGKITDGIMEVTVAPKDICFHMEIERLDEKTLFGLFWSRRFISYDLGEHFLPAPPQYDQVGHGGSYPSVHKRYSDGKFIQLVCEKDFAIQESEDLQTWTTLTHVLPKERICDEQGRYVALVHVSSFTELPMPDGSTRIFLPIAFRNYVGKEVAGHYTEVFYSDNGGKTWQKSEKNVRDLPDFPKWYGNMSWCESKVIRCSDGRLRMFCTRTITPCIYYADSFDDGKTWTQYGEITDMPTPTSSFAICPDPAIPGSYLMVYVNDQPHFCSTIFPRTRLTLVRTDGLQFEKILDVERFCTSENPLEGTAELYQILDPCINVFEDYIFISFGRSDDVGGDESPHHHGQRIRFVRIDRKAAGI